MSVSPSLVPLDVPVGWPVGNESVNLVHAVLLLGGVPLLVSLLLAAAIYGPALMRGEPIAPGGQPVEDQWLGGPRTGTAELTGPGPEDSHAGGASGRW